jgi:hypothetical protein
MRERTRSKKSVAGEAATGEAAAQQATAMRWGKRRISILSCLPDWFHSRA